MWDFSKLKTLVYDSIVFDIKTSPSNFSNYFPTANEVITEFNFSNGMQVIERHNIKNANEYSSLGSAYPNNNNFAKNSPTKKILRFPFVFNTTFKDSTTTVKYDGFGTIKLPSGTFKNCFRTHYKDSINQNKEFNIYTWFDSTKKLLTITDYGFFKEILFYNNNSQKLNAKNINTSNFNIFPNPSKGNFYIQSNFSEYKIEIIDVLGNLVYLSEENEYKKEIHLENKGIYLLKIHNNSKVMYQKIIIE